MVVLTMVYVADEQAELVDIDPAQKEKMLLGLKPH